MRRRLFAYGGAGLVTLLLSVIISLSLGSAHLPVGDVWRIALHHIPGIGKAVAVTWPDQAESIVMKVRFPRVALAVLVGAALSLAGAGFQGVLRNPLADPFTLGVASGSSAGAAFLILMGVQFSLLGQWSIPLTAFVAGMATLLAVFRLAAVDGKIRTETLILAGVVVQAFFGAIVSFMVTLSHSVVNEILFWLMGSLALRGWAYPAALLPYTLAGLVLLLGYGRTLNLFALGDRHAAHLGVSVERTKWVVLAISTLLTAAAVSMAGVIGFVGLIVPHLTRMMVGPDYRLIVPLSALFGGIYVLWADTAARMLMSPVEIPLGVITAFLGAPFFAFLLSKHKKANAG